MKAEDTVLKKKWMSKEVTNDQNALLLEQAKITWPIAYKAGYEASGNDLERYLLKWKQAGRKEVVEFIENNALRANYMADPTKECWGISDYELAKLKDWGVLTQDV